MDPALKQPNMAPFRGTEQELRKVQILRRSDVFAVLSPEALSALAEKATVVRMPRRRFLFSQGDVAAALCVIASGRARVIRRGREEREFTVAYRGVGDIVGETVLAGSETHHDGAVATEQLEFLRIPLTAIAPLLEREALFARAMLSLMTARRVEAEDRVEALLSRTVESRVAEFLVRAANNHGVPESRGTLIGVKFTHQEIANYVGSTRETVTLTLGDMKRRGLILFDHRRVVVTNSDGLQALA